MLKVAPIEKLVGFYRMGFSLPVLKFNRQVKRNIERFSADFMFQLTKEDCLWC